MGTKGSKSAGQIQVFYKKIPDNIRDFEPDVNRTRNLLIWSQTRYHCATDPVEIKYHKIILPITHYF